MWGKRVYESLKQTCDKAHIAEPSRLISELTLSVQDVELGAYLQVQAACRANHNPGGTHDKGTRMLAALSQGKDWDAVLLQLQKQVDQEFQGLRRQTHAAGNHVQQQQQQQGKEARLSDCSDDTEELLKRWPLTRPQAQPHTHRPTAADKSKGAREPS